MVVWLLLFLQPTITTATCDSHYTETTCNGDGCNWDADNSMCLEPSSGGDGDGQSGDGQSGDGQSGDGQSGGDGDGSGGDGDGSGTGGDQTCADFEEHWCSGQKPNSGGETYTGDLINNAHNVACTGSCTKNNASSCCASEQMSAICRNPHDW